MKYLTFTLGILFILGLFAYAFLNTKKPHILPPDPPKKEKIVRPDVVIPEGTTDWGCDPKSGKCS